MVRKAHPNRLVYFWILHAFQKIAETRNMKKDARIGQDEEDQHGKSCQPPESFRPAVREFISYFELVGSHVIISVPILMGGGTEGQWVEIGKIAS